MNEHTLWDGPNAERAVRTANAFEVRRNARRQRLDADPWEGALTRIYGHSERVGDPSYEPSQPARRHNPALWWALAMVCGLLAWGAAIGFVRRMRPESRMACFALMVAAVALLKGWGAA